MRMIERRIGLLFAGFLLCFLVIVGRAFWLQGVQGAQLASEATYQQTEIVTVPGLRGSLLDRHGNPLAVLRRRGDDLRDALPGEEPAADGGQAGADPRAEARAKCSKALTEESGFSYVAHKVDLPTAARIERLELPGIGQLPDSRRTYPQGEMAGQVIGAVGSENQGLTGLEAGEESVLARHRRRTADRQRRARRTDPAGNGQGSRGRRRHPADARPGDPEEDRRRCSPKSAKPTSPKGATAIVDGPAQLADPGDGQLAAGRPRRPLRSQHRRPAEPGDRLQLRAGLDLQGVHRLRRAGRKTGHAGRPTFTLPPSSRSPTGRSKTPRNAAPKR